MQPDLQECKLLEFVEANGGLISHKELLDIIADMIGRGVLIQTGWRPNIIYYTPKRYQEIEQCSLNR